MSKSYGGTVAVREVSFIAPDGALTYVLGPNGAGKTTLLKMIAGLAKPDVGSITINGAQLREHRDIKSEVGFCLNAFARNPKHTALQHLRWQAKLAGVAPAAAPEMLNLVGLSSVASRQVGGFSFGMVQRLGVAAALLGDPKTIVLDEPANGLDVEGTIWLRELLTGLATAGKCLLVASHSLSEVEITASRVVIMGQGRVLSDTDLTGVLAQGSGPRRLESAYLAITRNSVEYEGSGVAR